MKKKTIRRAIPSKGDRPNKQGLLSYVEYEPESIEDFKSIVGEFATSTDARLRAIKEYGELYLAEHGLSRSGKFDKGSPEYLAKRAADFAKVALNGKNSVDVRMGHAMDAATLYNQFLFTLGIEAAAIRGIAVEKSRPRKKSKLWAQNLAEAVATKFPNDSFSMIWMKLGNFVEGKEFAGYQLEVVYEENNPQKGEIWADSDQTGKHEKLTRGSFRVQYFKKFSKKL